MIVDTVRWLLPRRPNTTEITALSGSSCRYTIYAGEHTSQCVHHSCSSAVVVACGSSLSVNRARALTLDGHVSALSFNAYYRAHNPSALREGDVAMVQHWDTEFGNENTSLANKEWGSPFPRTSTPWLPDDRR